MPIQVVNGATLMCTFGTFPSTLTVLPTHRVMSGNQPAANIGDHLQLVNIKPFGMCTTLSNPQVASATSAAWGTLTPQPCLPQTPIVWVAGAPTVLVDYLPALDDKSTCTCIYGGVISVTQPGQFTEMIP